MTTNDDWRAALAAEGLPIFELDWRAALEAAGLEKGLDGMWWAIDGFGEIWRRPDGTWRSSSDMDTTYATEEEAARAWLAARVVSRG